MDLYPWLSLFSTSCQLLSSSFSCVYVFWLIDLQGFYAGIEDIFFSVHCELLPVPMLNNWQKWDIPLETEFESLSGSLQKWCEDFGARSGGIVLFLPPCCRDWGKLPLATGFLLPHDKLCWRFDIAKYIIWIGPAPSLCQCNRCDSSHNVNKGYVLLKRKRGQNTI